MDTITITKPQTRLSFSHFGINCFDKPKMEDFYTRVMGMVVADRGYIEHLDLDLVFLTLDPNEHHQLILCNGRKEGEIRTSQVIGGGRESAINQISFRASSLTEMSKMRKKLIAEGIDPITPLNHGLAWAMYFRDPEGNAMEMFVDSDWYVRQPCGEPLDLDKPEEQIKAETEAMCRQMPDFEPIAQWRARIADKIAAAQRA
ncbi:MAG: VOC family protein [Alphaproteobacteria bacterium]